MANYILNLKHIGAKKDKKYELICSGDLSLNSITDVFNEIHPELKKIKSLHVIADKPEQIDISFVQLLQVLKKEFETKDKAFSFELNLNENDITLFNRTGLNNLLEK